MLENYLKTAFRNLIRHRSDSLINIFGLTLGITGCILIFSYVMFEFSFDRFHVNAGRIHRLILKRTAEGRTQEMASAGGPVGPALIRDFPEVLEAVRISPTVIRSFRYEDKSFFEDGVFYADRSLFRVFSFEMTRGDPDTALAAPYTMVLTEETAQKYFGGKDPLGEVIRWENSADYTVTGVVRAPPANSHFKFNALASLETYFKYDPRLGSRWRIWGYPTYLLLREDADPKEFERRLPDFIRRYLGPVIQDSGGDLEMFLQPLSHIHLNARLGNPLGGGNDIRLVLALAGIALILLGVAGINFMNLTTARARIRAREIGVRKILGAGRRNLIAQFMGESFLFTAISFVLALVLSRLARPLFNNLAGRSVSLNDSGIPGMILLPAAILMLGGMIAGCGPALFLSSLQPVSALKGFREGRGRSGFRSILVVVQFAVSITLIIGTIFISRQQSHMRSRDLGFSKDQKFVIAIQNEEIRRGLESYKTAVLGIEGVTGACATSMVPGDSYLFSTNVTPEGTADNPTLQMDHFFADDDFIDVYEIEILRGRGFSREMPTDVDGAVMINQTAVEKLGWEEPLGKIIHVPSHPYGEDTDTVPRTVIGVFRDIHQRSLYFPIRPTMIEHVRSAGPIENRPRRFTIQLGPHRSAGEIAAIRKKWEQVYPGYPFHGFFLDEAYDDLHRGERRLAGIFRVFAFVAVLIGGLGLLGLAAFSTSQRIREIGIRKVFGSTTGAIMVRLIREFVRLIVIANLVAWPVAYLAVRKWLENFPYPVKIGWTAFAAAALLSLIVGLATVGCQTWRAARADPVESLRYE